MSLNTKLADSVEKQPVTGVRDDANARFFSKRFLALLAVALFALVLTGPPNIGQENERRMVAYVSDAVENNHWACQYDEEGGIASKPPMFCWLSGAATVLTGKINRLTLYWPTALATLALSCILFRAGKSHFGTRAGFFAGWSYLLSSAALHQMATCRYDGLFAFFVTLAALAAFNAWTSGRGWIWFWLASAGATLTKGPLGLILAATGLLAAIWERKSSESKRIRGSHLSGVAIFFLISGGWFALAYWQVGSDLIHKMIYKELFAHAVGKEKETLSGPGFYKPLVYFITGFAPWSFLTLLGIWRAWKHPSPNLGQRRFERFLVCWFVPGLLLFSLGGHQRARLIYPLIPVAALLAGIQMARLTSAFSLVKLRKAVAISTVLTLVGIGLFLHFIDSRTKSVRQTTTMRQLAAIIQNKVGTSFPFTHADPPFAFPFYLHELHQFASISEAAELLRGDATAFVSVEQFSRLQKQLGSNAPVYFDLLQWPSNGTAIVHIVGNHPRLEWTEQMAIITGPFRVVMNHARLVQKRGAEFTFRNSSTNAWATFFNLSNMDHLVRVQSQTSDSPSQERVLKPGELWRAAF